MSRWRETYHVNNLPTNYAGAFQACGTVLGEYYGGAEITAIMLRQNAWMKTYFPDVWEVTIELEQ